MSFIPITNASLLGFGAVGRPLLDPNRDFYTRIHEKKDNCLVFIAPTARWILMRRTDEQSAAVPIKISYFNGRVVLFIALGFFEPLA